MLLDKDKCWTKQGHNSSQYCMYKINTISRGNIVSIEPFPITEYISHNLCQSPAQFENRIKPRVYAKRIMRSTMYEKAPFCQREKAYGKLVFQHVSSALVKSNCLFTRKF